MTLSILIPTYNDESFELARTLQVQAAGCLNEDYEIIVADDGSTDEEIKLLNSRIDNLPGCRIIFCEKNRGRAAIKNFLVRESVGEYLLFIDGDMVVRKNDFISEYIENIKGNQVVYGGYAVNGDEQKLHGNLRYRYEMKCRDRHTAEKRSENPYKDFHTSNFLVMRKVMEKNPYNEDFTEYGYEDVFFGKQLKEQSIGIKHLDNPASFEKYEENADFLRKTDESIRTLLKFKDSLQDYSSLLRAAVKIKNAGLTNVFALLFKIFNKPIKNNLLGNNPSILLFTIYKLLKINYLYKENK